MLITKEMYEARREQLLATQNRLMQQRQAALDRASDLFAQINGAAGAVADCEWWLARLTEPEATAVAQLEPISTPAAELPSA